MAANNDDRLWGGNEFTKKRGGNPNAVPGEFVYASRWTEADMLSAKHYIGLGHLSNEEILVRYRAVGGSVHAVECYDCAKWLVDFCLDKTTG